MMTMTSNRSNEEEQKEEPRYSITYVGCNHTAIRTADDLRYPAKRSKLDITPVMLCPKCLREDYGTCAKSPYHRIASITEIPPSLLRRKVLRDG
jgi:hypothetical protein